MDSMQERIANLSPEKRALFMERLKQSGAQKKAAPTSIPAYPRDGALPLSFGQQRLWFLDQFEAGNVVYNIPVAYDLRGRLDVEAFRRAINMIVRRHEVLRTTFDVLDGLPVLHIHNDLKLNIPLIEVDQADIHQHMAQEAARPFDLSKDSPLRVSLLRVSEAQHVMLLTLHHIASDGWSFGVLNRELAALYDAFMDGADSSLVDLPVQYADYAAWQRGPLQGAALDAEMDYWRAQLSGTPVILELPTDRSRPPIQTYHGAAIPLALPADLAARLKAISKQEGVTLFMTLLAGFKTLLARYTGQYDVCVGSPIANRTQAEVEHLIGFFVNTLALRTTLAPETTFRAAVQQIKETALGAYSHQTMPFEKLVEELQPERNPSHHPLFQVLFALQNQPGIDLALRGLDVTQIEVEATTSKFDLSVYAWEADSGIEGFVEYNTDLFDPATLQRMLGHFEMLLAGACADPDMRLCDLPLLTASEERQLLIQWNDTDAEYDRAVCIHDLIEAQAARTPDAIAITFEGEHLTYRTLDQRANQLAHYLQALGAAPDQLVGICVERSLDMVVSLLGVLKSGAAYVPIDPALPKDRIAFMLADAAPAVLITQSHLTNTLPEFVGSRVCIDTDAATLASLLKSAPPRTVTPNHLMYVIYTSGSTGKPKGVQIPHSAVVNFMETMRHEPGMCADDVLVSVTTLSFDIAALEIYLPLMVGAQVVLVSRDVATDGPALIQTMERAQATVMQATPATWRLLLESGWQGNQQLRALCGGEALLRDLADQLLGCCAELWNLYGPTETTIWSARHRVMRDEEGATVCIGRPIANTQLYVLDANRQPAPIGVSGELYIGGDGLARGYLNRAELTAEKYVASPFVDGARLYRTGDLVRYRADGTLDFVGRIDHQVKIRGFRIELGEIEALLMQHPTVQKAVTIVREDTPGDKRLAAYVVAHPNAAINIGDLRTHLKAHLPDYMVPSAFMVLEALPLTPNGKIDRRALPMPEQTRREEGEITAPRTEQEARIAAIWSEVLGIAQIGIDDNFFDLGGESFKAVRAVRRISDTISVMDLFKYPTIRQLAERLEQHQTKLSGLLHELTPPIPAAQRQLSLIAVPFAGGGAISYQPVARLMQKGISLYAVEMPGHDFSKRDEPLDGLESIAQKVVAEIQRDITGPIALLGHCLGGALTVAIARELRHKGIKIEGIFIGGHFPQPRLPGRFFELMRQLFPMEKWTARRTALEFLRAMGFFTEVTDPKEQEFVIRNFLHDARETEDYYTRIYAETAPQKLNAPICCIIGEMDRATELYEERCHEWEHFSDEVSMALIPKAGHYFLKHQADQVADIIGSQIGEWREAQQTPARTERPSPHRTRTAEPRLSIFYLIAIGQLVSMMGTGLTSFALGIWVYQQTGSVSAFAFISVFALLPGILLAPIAGAVADRFDRRKIMIGADMLAAISTILVAAMLFTGSLQIWHIYIAASVAAIANAFQQPAYLAAITQLTPKRYYGRANGIVQLSGAMGMLFAPLLGGVLTGIIGLHGVVAIDFTTFLFAVTVTLLVRFPNTLFKKREEPFLKEVLGGWQYIIKRHGLTAIIVFTTFINYLFAVMEVLVTPLVLSFGNPAVLGSVLAANGLGLLGGSVLMSVWGGAKRRTDGIILSVMLFGLSVLIIGLGSSPVFPAIGLFGVGFSIALINAHWLSIVQTKVGLELQGRVMATNLMMVWAMMPLGYLTAGPLADRVFEPLMAAGGPLAATFGMLIGTGAGRGVGLMMILSGLLAVIFAVLAFRYRPIRFLEDILPDALADSVIEADKDAMQEAANRRLMQIAAHTEG